MYGENHFLVELAASTLQPSITGELPASGLHSMLSGSERSPEDLWPFSTGAVKYLKQVTIMAVIDGRAPHFKLLELKQRFERLVGRLQSGDCLQKLTIDVNGESDHYLERLCWGLAGKNDFMIRVKDVRPVDEDDDKVKLFLQTLGKLPDVEQFVLSVQPESEVLLDLLYTPAQLKYMKQRGLLWSNQIRSCGTGEA